MKRRTAWLCMATGLILATLGARSPHAADATLKKRLVGAWVTETAFNVRADGSRFQPLGTEPKGMLILEPGGHFTWILLRPDIPKYASNNRLSGSAAEFAATAKGTLAYYGTYTVNDADSSMVMRIEYSSFPNFNGATQRREISLRGDRLDVVNAAGASGGTAHVVWRRVR